jgi:hypothetical protein
MKILNTFFGSCFALICFCVSTTAPLTSCTKEIEKDTVTVTIHDTIIKEITDTIIQLDTVCKLDLGLVAHYNFTQGSLEDLTDYNNDIVFNNAVPAADINGDENNAYLFDGSSSYMKVANSASLNPQNITLMARVKVNDFYMGLCHFSDILSKGLTDISEGLYVIRIADPYGFCYEPPQTDKEFFVGSFGDNVPEGAAAGAAADTTFIQKGNWYTVTYTYDGKTSHIYVNGKLQASQEKIVTSSGNERDLFIGRHEDPNFPYWFNGLIDEIRIYDRAVTRWEAAALAIPPVSDSK